jgi:hypothetical protein
VTPRTLGSVVAVMAVAATASAATDSAAPAPSAWVVGDTSPRVGTLFEAWFNRGAAGAADRPVTVGAPGSLQVWLRRSSEDCAAVESAGRRTTTNGDGGLLYVCARATNPGEARLVASTGAPALAVSDPVTIRSRWAVGDTLAAVLTTAVGFVGGLLTSLLTGWLQDRQTLAREKRTVAEQVHATLAKVLSAEVLANSAAISAFLDGAAPPVILQTAAYNDAAALGKTAWDYLDGVELAAYRKRIDDLYAAIPAYQRAVQAWLDANANDKPARLAAARTEAERVRQRLRGV